MSCEKVMLGNVLIYFPLSFCTIQNYNLCQFFIPKKKKNYKKKKQFIYDN